MAKVLSKADKDCSSEEVEQSASWKLSSKKRFLDSSLLSSVAPLKGKIPLLLSRSQRSALDGSIALLGVVEEDREISSGSWAELNSDDASESEGVSGWLIGIGGAARFNVESVLEKSVLSSSVNHVESGESNTAADAIVKSMTIVLSLSRKNMMKRTTGSKSKTPG